MNSHQMNFLPIVQKFTLFLVIISLVVYCIADSDEDCRLKENCSACIRSKGCVWCAKTTASIENDTLIRCRKESVTEGNWCPDEDIIYKTSNNKMTLLEDDELTTGASDKAIQIKPQKIQIKLRKGEEIRLNVSYQQAEDYPLDLYFLMDLSASMHDDKIKLSQLGAELVRTMKKSTNNFQIGFGSFVDKPEMPFTSTVPEKLKVPCTLKDGTSCSAPYGFKHQMRLTTETQNFITQVANAPVSGNLDFPEGGFDAIMQVLVCTDKIGWRPQSRRMLIMSTDAGFHMAGDGKLAGIVEPNDEKCHLNDDGEYTYSTLQDYPSISQLDRQATENNINIIFAVTENQKNVYKVLSENIEGASFGTLTNDSSNVIDFVKGEYEKLLNSIKLSDNSSGDVQIQYFTKCSESVEKATNECKGLKGRPVIDFGAVIKILDCPIDKKNWKQTIQIRPGALSESLIVDLEILCDCPCEREGNPGFEKKSKSCSSDGDLTCGICSCDGEKYGRFCQCDGAKNSDSADSMESCKETNSSEICSGFGFCKCGVCDCKKRDKDNESIYGKFCECNNFSCKRHGGLLCSGIDNGRCECGECVCQSGWGGNACECEKNNATCIAPNSEEVCSGRGTCVCGACQCTSDENVRYSGKFCQECPHCTSTCDELAPCVECKIHKTGTYSEEQCQEKCNKIEMEDSVDALDMQENDNLEDNRNERLCKVPDDKGCSIIFTYKYENDDMIKRVTPLKTKECSKVIDTTAVICAIVLTTVIAGVIILIIWKIVTMIHDSREYAKFEKERQQAIFDRGDNPLYKPSTSEFSNPAFGRSFKRK